MEGRGPQAIGAGTGFVYGMQDRGGVRRTKARQPPPMTQETPTTEPIIDIKRLASCLIPHSARATAARPAATTVATWGHDSRNPEDADRHVPKKERSRVPGTSDHSRIDPATAAITAANAHGVPPS